MALFTDGAIASIEDLRGHDTQLLNVATVEGIDVTRKLALAQEEFGVELTGLLERVASTGSYAVTGLGSGLGTPSMRQVVVTSPIKLWNIYRALEMVYADAYNSQLNDRYAGKRDADREMVKWAFHQLLQGGLGIVASPVPQATTPAPAIAAGSLADDSYYVAVAWTNAAGEEGASSVPAVIQVSGSTFAVTAAPPAGLTGWNVYCGTSATNMTMQNAAALAPNQTWLQPNTLSVTGRLAGSGQQPTYRLPVPRTIQRG